MDINVNNNANSASNVQGTTNINNDDLAMSQKLSTMTSDQLRDVFMHSGAVHSLGIVVDFLSNVRNSVIEAVTQSITNSKNRQQDVLKELQTLKYHKITVDKSDTADAKNLAIQQASEKNSVIQKKIDALNNQLSLEKTFVSRASQETDRMQASINTFTSFFSAVIRQYQTGLQNIVK